jgi:hypothetical protein
MGNNVFDKSVSVSAITFEKTPIKILSKEVKAREKSKDIAKDLAKNLLTDNLRHILVFLDGL